MHQHFLKAVLVGVATTALVACGSNNNDSPSDPGPVATTDVPGAALDSVSGLLAYINTLIGSSSDTAEPVLVGTAVLPTSDTTEPVN